MDAKLVPADAQLAAKRGFIRTTAQAYSTALAGGITVAIVSDALAKAAAGDWAPLIISGIVALFSPLLAGGASYLSILSNGIPADYQPKEPEEIAE